MKFIYLLVLVCICGSCCLNKQKTNESNAHSHMYFTQNLPDDSSRIFAPGIISTSNHEHSFPSFSPDGNTILWNIEFFNNYTYDFPSKVLAIEYTNGNWGKPNYYSLIDLAETSGAFFSPKGDKIFFNAVFRNKEKYNMDIWFIEKSESGWSKPKAISGSINTLNVEGQVTVTKDETLYYRGYLEGVKNNYGIFRSRLKDGIYQEPEALPEIINSAALDWTPFISPDESYLLWSSFREGGYGSGDIWISFRDSSHQWSKPTNLGPSINEAYNERFPYVSPDGKYLFYLTDKVSDELLVKKELNYSEAVHYHSESGNGQCDIYWVSAKVIYDLKESINY